jgi:oligopeptide/dipeptide ABC transporter ATP-binding protein
VTVLRPSPQHVPPGSDLSAPLLDVRELRTEFALKSSTVHAVDGVSFQVLDGEAVGIAGESGCGKTTTALSLVQLLPSNATVSGSVRLRGIELLDKSEKELARYRWREISIIFQGAMNSLNPVKRMVDQIVEAMLVHKHLDERTARVHARELLEFVGIPARRGSAYPHQLSGGMRQRAMIAMALSCDPAVVIGDEPTTALDVMVQAQIMELFARLRSELGLSLLLITHDLSVISETCDRVVIMYAGRIAEVGPVRTVFRTPRHPYTRGLLSAFPSIRAGRRTLDVIQGSPPDLRNPPPGCRFAPRCSVAMDVCTQVAPQEVAMDDGVRVACHLYPGSPASTDEAVRPPVLVTSGRPT